LHKSAENSVHVRKKKRINNASLVFAGIAHLGCLHVSLVRRVSLHLPSAQTLVTVALRGSLLLQEIKHRVLRVLSVTTKALLDSLIASNVMLVRESMTDA